MALAPEGHLFFSDHYKIRRIRRDGLISTVAGGHGCGLQSGDGGPALQASLCHPWGIAVGPDGSGFAAGSTTGLLLDGEKSAGARDAFILKVDSFGFWR